MVLTQGPFGAPNSACLRLNRTLSLECPVGTGLHQFAGRPITGSPGGCLFSGGSDSDFVPCVQWGLDGTSSLESLLWAPQRVSPLGETLAGADPGALRGPKLSFSEVHGDFGP